MGSVKVFDSAKHSVLFGKLQGSDNSINECDKSEDCREFDDPYKLHTALPFGGVNICEFSILYTHTHTKNMFSLNLPAIAMVHLVV